MNMGCRAPKYLKEIEYTVSAKLRLLKTPTSELLEAQQIYHDEILEIYNDAFKSLIEKIITNSNILSKIKAAYDKALQLRNERISQFITQDRVFGISERMKERDVKIKDLRKQNQTLREQNSELTFQISKLKKDMGKLNDEKLSDYLNLMRERDARYTLYFENLELHLKLKELDGSTPPIHTVYGDPAVLRIALDRCREQLSITQSDLKKKIEEYSVTVPRRDYDSLEAKYCEVTKNLHHFKTELENLQEVQKKLLASKKLLKEELIEVKERCSELERAGTPRPQWELCADFIGGGRDRWWQLAGGLSSRDILRVLLKELGPASESEHLEYFDGLGLDPAIPPYLRYEGKVRNLRLSRREVNVIINDIWLAKQEHMNMSMQEYVTKYFEERYQQSSVRVEWAYNLCAGVEQMLEEPHVKLFWAILHDQLSERVYWGLRDHWTALSTHLRHHANGREVNNFCQIYH